MSDDDRKDLPPVTAPNFLDRLRETVMTYLGRQGDTLDRGVTLRDVQDVNLANVRAGFLSTGRGLVFAGLGSAVEPAYEVDLTPPPTPTGLVVSAGISKLIIDWDDPTFTQGHGYDRTIIYGATYSGTGPLPTFSSAVELTQAPGSVTAYATQPATEWHIWIKWRTKDGVLSISPAGGTNGVSATTGQDVRLLLDALTAAAENPLAPYTKYAVRAGLFYVASDTGPTDAPLFAVVTSPIVVGGVTVPIGVYMADAFIMNGTITNLKVANAAIDDAKVANMSVSKLIAGSIAVGEFAQSTGYVAGSTGWRISGNGNAEFSGVVARGAIFASSGTIGGSDIGSTFMRSTNYVLNTQGWNLNSNGTGQIGGFVVTNTGIQSVNYVAGTSGWRFDFAGAIEARSGTFAGALAAATGTFSGALSAATGTFAGSLSAASGTFSGTLTASAINAVDTINIAGQAVTAPSFTSAGVSDLTMTYTLTGAAGVPFSVFVLASLVQTNFSTIELQVNGSTVWTEAPIASTVLCKGWVVSLVPGAHSIRVFSTNAGNTNGTAIYALATKR